MEALVEEWLEAHVNADRLNDLERQEVARIARNLTAEEAAAEVGQSEETVRARRKSICKKLGLRNTREMLHQLLEFSCEKCTRLCLAYSI